jgi:tetratricopeptide (TPR) repeat protein
MSQPASESNEPRPAVPAHATVPEVPQEFDLLAFWIQHQKLVIRLLLAVLVGVAIWGAFLFKDYRRRAGSENALADAKNAEDYRKVVTDWSGTSAAGTAYVRLAEELRKENKPKEAAVALREFLDKYQTHPLRVPAAHSLAASLETAGEFDAALVAYQNFVTAHGRSAFAPLGLIGQARVLIATSKPDDARLILETVDLKYPGNPFTYDARTLLETLKNPAGTKTGGSPRPTPRPAPATPADSKPVVTPDPVPGAPGNLPGAAIKPPDPAKQPGAKSPPVPAPKPPAKKTIGADSTPGSKAPAPAKDSPKK